MTAPLGGSKRRGPIRLPAMTWLALTFIPWSLNWVATALPPGLGRHWVQTGLPLLLAILIWGYQRVFGQNTLFETGTLVYYLLAFLVTIGGSGFFLACGDVLSSLALGLLWTGSLATAMPLTGEYSKWELPPALWTNAVFVRTNAVITVVWAVIFLFQAAFALAGQYAPAEALLWLILRYLLLAPASVFTAWYQKWYPAYGSMKAGR